MKRGLGCAEFAIFKTSSTRGLSESSRPFSTRVLKASDSIWNPASSMLPTALRISSDKPTYPRNLGPSRGLQIYAVVEDLYLVIVRSEMSTEISHILFRAIVTA